MNQSTTATCLYTKSTTTNADNGGTRTVTFSAVELSGELGSYETFKAMFWPWLELFFR